MAGRSWITPIGTGVTAIARLESAPGIEAPQVVTIPTDARPGTGSVGQELVSRAQRGETDAFRDIVHEAGPRLYGIAYRILRDPDRAEDALQQALIAIWQGLPGLRDPSRFDAWSCRLIVNASYREARRERRWTTLVREIRADPAGGERVDGIVDRDEVERSFRRLTPEHRAVLVLHHYLGLPIEQVADILGIPYGTATSRLHYASRSFRAAFEADARGAVAWRTTT